MRDPDADRLRSENTALRAEVARLRETESRYRGLFGANPNPMWVFDQETLAFLAVNDAAVAGYGYTREEFLRMTIEDIRPPEDLPRLLETVRTPVRGLDTSGVWRHLKKDGSLIFVEITAHSLVFDGRPAEMVLALDVTDRLRAEAALKASEERFRALIERNSGILAVVDRQARFSFVSPSMELLTGRPVAALLGQSAFEQIAPEDVGETDQVFSQLLTTPGLTRRFDLRVVRADGAVRLADVVATSLFHVPAVDGIVINARDVTEARQLETQLVEARKLDSLGRLAGGVAHDFNNLLTLILGYAEFAEEEAAEGRASLADIREIRRAAESAKAITSQLLSIARRQAVQARPLGLNEELRGTERLLQQVVRAGIDIDLVLAPDLWPVRADPTHVRQVMLNLAINAADAMGGTGRLVVRTANVELAASDARRPADLPPGPYVQLTVTDSGTGMPPDVKAHVFEPFFTTKPMGRGTGLGLAVVYGIVKQAGGAVSVESEPGRGTTFTVLLPRLAQAPVLADAGAALAIRHGQERVLVVEDEAGVRELTVRALQEHGYTVHAARDGTEALLVSQAANEPFDLLLADVVMPGLGGRAVAEELVHRWPGLKVLYVSGYAADSGVVDREGERTALLMKPFTPSTLLEKVRTVLDQGIVDEGTILVP